MPEIKVNSILARTCSRSEIPYAVCAYHTLFPNSKISVNDYNVDWWEDGKSFTVNYHNASVSIYKYDIVNGQFLYIASNTVTKSN